MKINKVEMLDENKGSLFNRCMQNNQLHDLEGTLWINSEDDVHMFCQVASDQFAMILLSEGNRNVDTFCLSMMPVDQLNGYKRYYGSIKITPMSAA